MSELRPRCSAWHIGPTLQPLPARRGAAAAFPAERDFEDSRDREDHADGLGTQNQPKYFLMDAEMDVDFLVSEGIFVKGRAASALQTVSLWLGANTIVELSFEEAQELLKANLDNAHSSLAQITEELSYIKDQKTTTEVNVSECTTRVWP